MEPVTKAAKLRQLMPEIEEKLASGVTLVAIHQALVLIGFDLTFQTLKTYLYRCRKNELKARLADSAMQPRQASIDSSQKDCLPESTDNVQNKTSLRSPLSMQEIGRLISPDPVQQAEKLARYERIARQQRRSQK